MATSLANLAENLSSANLDKFREVSKVFNPSEMALAARKGVYPYEYMDSWDKLDATSLPDKFQFYSALTETHVSDVDYNHALRVWNHFSCTTLGAYSDLYLKIDVLINADVFENFRDICMATYHLDPAHYYTSPGFSFDCMLKFTKVQLSLLTDFEKVLFIESGTRGGLVQASKRHARANNTKMPGYNAYEPSTSLIYLDANNLYGYSMCKYMPISDFEWYPGNPEVALAQLEWMSETDDVGRIYEVDISYPATPARCSQRYAVLAPRQHTTRVHCAKTHRVLEFRQSPWLAPYINLNTELRKQAANKFEEQFFKDLNNSVFGKTIENMRKRFNLELVSCPVRMRKLINRLTFKYCTTYGENLSVVIQHNSEVDFCKPIYIGFSVLELSKVLMYGFHYDVMKRHYGDKIDLLYTDTDSLFYRVVTNDFYDDLTDNPNLMRFIYRTTTSAIRLLGNGFQACSRTRPMASPPLFLESYDPRDFMLTVAAEHSEPSVDYSLGFHAGQQFPWKSPDSSPPLQQSTQEMSSWNSPSILNLLSAQFPNDREILNDAQSFHLSDFEWEDIPRKENTPHWKKKIISEFNTK
ncbi:hypothetical protein AGLY_005559, partial [Aphis glycines]